MIVVQKCLRGESYTLCSCALPPLTYNALIHSLAAAVLHMKSSWRISRRTKSFGPALRNPQGKATEARQKGRPQPPSDDVTGEESVGSLLQGSPSRAPSRQQPSSTSSSPSSKPKSRGVGSPYHEERRVRRTFREPKAAISLAEPSSSSA